VTCSAACANFALQLAVACLQLPIKSGLLVRTNVVFGGFVMRITAPDNHNRNIDSLIRTWIVVAAAVVAWLAPVPWYGSLAIFLGVLLPLGIFYPLPGWPRK
jgi:hypothetical protein